jgi:hypothetical protein
MAAEKADPRAGYLVDKYVGQMVDLMAASKAGLKAASMVDTLVERSAALKADARAGYLVDK